jgi:hypothetical protein
MTTSGFPPATAKKLVLYPTSGKRKGYKICKAMAIGLHENGVGCQLEYSNAAMYHSDSPAFFYGIDHFTRPLIEKAERGPHDFYYADNAYYFGRGEYFRVTKNAMMHDGTGNAKDTRFREHGLTIQPWRKTGRYVLITTQSKLFYDFRIGMDRLEWTRRVVAAIQQVTDREIRVCHKPDAKYMSRTQPHVEDFEKLIGRAWCLVTHSSSTAVGALLRGVPVFSTAPSMASIVGLSDLSKIEEPFYPDDREQWFWNLAAQQWTKAEMSEGICWRGLQEQPQAWDGCERRLGVPVGSIS